jgi:hypothetical protein
MCDGTLGKMRTPMPDQFLDSRCFTAPFYGMLNGTTHRRSRPVTFGIGRANSFCQQTNRIAGVHIRCWRRALNKQARIRLDHLIAIEQRTIQVKHSGGQVATSNEVYGAFEA